MGRKRKGSVIGDIGKMLVDTVASPFEALTGQNFVNFKYTSDFGKGASKVVEPINKAIGGATVALGTTALNALAPGAGTALSGFGQGLGKGMKSNLGGVQQPPMQMSNKTRPTSGINSVPYGVQEGMPKTGYRNGGPMDSADLNRFIKSSIAANRGKNFVDRIVDPYAPSTNVMGVPATHYMSSAEVDGRNIVYPNVVQRGSGNQLQQLSPEEALDYALKTGEFMEFATPEEANNFATNYKQEMTRKFKHGGMLKAYNAPTHENGGQMIDQNANPTNNPNKAVGEIEKKETSWNGYVFSDTLGEGKKTFAQMSKEIVNRYKGKRDSLSKKTMERELMLLIQKNEAARLEKEQMEMQQMQNQFTEEELATLQNPQSPSKEQLDRLFAQQQQQQQGQPSQEQMMQMMQQQQMQQQGQPSEEEMMMMQQMQQQGAPQDMGQYRWGGNMDVPMYRYQDGGGLDDIDSKMMGQQKIVTNTALPKDSVPTNIYQQIAKGFFEAVAPQKQRANYNYYEQQNQFAQPFPYANYPFQNVADIPQEMNMQQETIKQPNTPKMPKQPNVPTINLQNANQEFDSKGGIVYQNGGMLEIPEAPLDEYKKGGWIQKVTKSIKKRGTEGVCTGDKFGGPSCPPGSKRYNLAKTFKAMAKKEDGGYIDSLPDISLAKYPDGGMIERADGSYSQRGLWDNIRDNIGSGKKPTKEMLEQERKIKAQEEYRNGGYVVKRSNERKGKTHVVIGPDGTKKYFGDPDLKNNPSEKAKKAFYARHKKNLDSNPYFRAYARATWRDGGMIPEFADGGNPPETPSLQEIAALGKMYNEMYNIAQAQQYKQPMPFSGNLVGQQKTPAPMTPVTLPEQQYRTPMDYKGPVPNAAAITEMSNPFASPAATTTPAPNYTPLNELGTPAPSPFQRMLGSVIKGATNMVAAEQMNRSQLTPENVDYLRRNMPGGMTAPSSFQLKDVAPFKAQSYRDKALNEITPVDLGFKRQPTLQEYAEMFPMPSSTLENTPNYISTERMLTPYEQADAFEQQMIAASQAAQGDTNIPYTPEYKPETPGQKEEPFKLRPLEYATIGLKGLALGKSIYDALQPAEKEQLRLNREAGLVNNMMAGRNVNMAAALNEALYNRNAALASNQARSANVQRALDMQTYSNAERNAIRSKLEEQNMNNQLRMQEAQVRADLGAAEAAERIRRQNVQSMNEAARRQFGQKAFQDLSTIGTELNKVQVYKDMYKNKKNMSYMQFKEMTSALNEATGGKWNIAKATPELWKAMQDGTMDFDQLLEFMKS